MTPRAQEPNPTARAPGVDPVHPFSIVPSESGLGSFPPLGSNVNALMVWPRFPPSFWGFEGVLEMIPEQAMTPPLGLITVAALCPATWNIHLIDRAVEELRDEDLRWADLVMVSAMHAQRVDAVAVLARARYLGRRTFIGGPWASSEPELLLLHPPGDPVAWVPVAPTGLRPLPTSGLTLRLSAGMLTIAHSRIWSKPTAADRTRSLPGLWHGDA